MCNWRVQKINPHKITVSKETIRHKIREEMASTTGYIQKTHFTIAFLVLEECKSQ